MDRDPTRVQGIEFGDLEQRLQSVSYPVTGDELIGRLGGETVELTDGSLRVETALDDHRDQHFGTTDEVLQTLKQMVGSDAFGRAGYSDRGNAMDDRDDRSF